MEVVIRTYSDDPPHPFDLGEIVLVSDDGTESEQLSTQEYYMVYVEMVSLYDFLKSKTKSEIRLSKSQIVTVDQKTKSVSFRFGDSVANRSRGSM